MKEREVKTSGKVDQNSIQLDQLKKTIRLGLGVLVLNSLLAIFLVFFSLWKEPAREGITKEGSGEVEEILDVLKEKVEAPKGDKTIHPVFMSGENRTEDDGPARLDKLEVGMKREKRRVVKVEGRLEILKDEQDKEGEDARVIEGKKEHGGRVRVTITRDRSK